eukprot:Rmarinus@m.25062
MSASAEQLRELLQRVHPSYSEEKPVPSKYTPPRPKASMQVSHIEDTSNTNSHGLSFVPSEPPRLQTSSPEKSCDILLTEQFRREVLTSPVRSNAPGAYVVTEAIMAKFEELERSLLRREEELGRKASELRAWEIDLLRRERNVAQSEEKDRLKYTLESYFSSVQPQNADPPTQPPPNVVGPIVPEIAPNPNLAPCDSVPILPADSIPECREPAPLSRLTTPIVPPLRLDLLGKGKKPDPSQPRHLPVGQSPVGAALHPSPEQSPGMDRDSLDRGEHTATSAGNVELAASTPGGHSISHREVASEDHTSLVEGSYLPNHPRTSEPAPQPHAKAEVPPSPMTTPRKGGVVMMFSTQTLSPEDDPSIAPVSASAPGPPSAEGQVENTPPRPDQAQPSRDEGPGATMEVRKPVMLDLSDAVTPDKSKRGVKGWGRPFEFGKDGTPKSARTPLRRDDRESEGEVEGGSARELRASPVQGEQLPKRRLFASPAKPPKGGDSSGLSPRHASAADAVKKPVEAGGKPRSQLPTSSTARPVTVKQRVGLSPRKPVTRSTTAAAAAAAAAASTSRASGTASSSAAVSPRKPLPSPRKSAATSVIAAKSTRPASSVPSPRRMARQPSSTSDRVSIRPPGAPRPSGAPSQSPQLSPRESDLFPIRSFTPTPAMIAGLDDDDDEDNDDVMSGGRRQQRASEADGVEAHPGTKLDPGGESTAAEGHASGSGGGGGLQGGLSGSDVSSARRRKSVGGAAGTAAAASSSARRDSFGESKSKRFSLDNINKIKEERAERRRRHDEERARRKAELERHAGDLDAVMFCRMIKEYRDGPLVAQEESEWKTLQDEETPSPKIMVCVRKRPIKVGGAEIGPVLDSTRGRLVKSKKQDQSRFDVVSCLRTQRSLVVHEPKTQRDMSRMLNNHRFYFDHVFSEDTKNLHIYEHTLAPLLECLCLGYDLSRVTCFAYGQTGSGKTYTMASIYKYAAQDLFGILAEVLDADPSFEPPTVAISFFELYVEKVLDLLQSRKEVRVLEDAKQNVSVFGLREVQVVSAEELLQYVSRGEGVRATSATNLNTDSSRSHSVLQISLRHPRTDDLLGKLSLVDLAGSERASDMNHTCQSTKREGSSINKSLLALKECIRAVDANSQHLPFRQSKLTQILKDCFVGEDCRTVMIATVNPDSYSCEHTLNTLRYAQRLKKLEMNN